MDIYNYLKKYVLPVIVIFSFLQTTEAAPSTALGDMKNASNGAVSDAGALPAAGLVDRSDWWSVPGGASDFPEPEPSCADGNCNGGGEIGNTGVDYYPAPSGNTGTSSPEMFVAKVCNGGYCVGMTSEKVVKKTSDYVVDKFVKGIWAGWSPRFRFPPMRREQIVKELIELEKDVIDKVQKIVVSDLNKMKSFEWATEEEKKKNERVIRNDLKAVRKWKRAARKEAKKGINFEPDHYGERESWTFFPGKAYDDFRKALQGREWYR